MNEQEQISQLSALFDNELPPAQAELVIRRALKDPGLRASWGRYALIGACVRSEPIHLDARQPDVARRVRMSLDAEAEHPSHSAPAFGAAGDGRRGWSLFGRGALGGAIAAGVAALSFFGLRSLDPQAVPAVQMAQTAAPEAAVTEAKADASRVDGPVLVAVNDTPPLAYTTPVANSPTQRINGQLANLVAAHSQVEASSMRIIPLNGHYDITQGAVDMTEAEIGAYR
ncbi:MAG: sigma-E factor negative regulatory protein [Steroidobacteraceae bacterium]